MNKSVEQFLKAVLLLKNEQEAAAFFRDICTVSELQEIGRRLDAAILSDSGHSVRAVAKITGLSTTTVARVSHWMKYGEGGYPLILSRLKEHEQ